MATVQKETPGATASEWLKRELKNVDGSSQR